MKKSVLQLALTGFVIFAVVCNIMAYIISSGNAVVSPALVQKTGNLQMALLVQTLLSGLYGASAIAGTALYNIEHWPLAKATVIHWLIIAAGYVPLSFYLDWVNSIPFLLVIEAMMLIGYFIIWLILCAVYQARVRELNELQKQYILKQNAKEDF